MDWQGIRTVEKQKEMEGIKAKKKWKGKRLVVSVKHPANRYGCLKVNREQDPCVKLQRIKGRWLTYFIGLESTTAHGWPWNCITDVGHLGWSPMLVKLNRDCPWLWTAGRHPLPVSTDSIMSLIMMLDSAQQIEASVECMEAVTLTVDIKV